MDAGARDTLARARRKLARIVARGCERHEGLFELLYHRLARRPDGKARMLRRFEQRVEAELDRVVREVRERGIAIWPGLFAESEFLDEANRLVASLEAPAREALGRAGEGKWAYDEIHERQYWPNTAHRVRTFYDGKHLSSQLPPVIERVMREPVLCEVVYRVLSTLSVFGVLAESLHPGEHDQSWHLDVLGDQLKAMVLLTHVDFKHSPMEYKVGSHLLRLPRRWNPDQQHGIYVSPEEVAELPGEVLQATGRAGDCVFFDSHGAHRGTRFLDGTRHVLAVYYQGGDTRRNALVRFLVEGSSET